MIPSAHVCSLLGLKPSQPQMAVEEKKIQDNELNPLEEKDYLDPYYDEFGNHISIKILC